MRRKNRLLPHKHFIVERNTHATLYGEKLLKRCPCCYSRHNKRVWYDDKLDKATKDLFWNIIRSACKNEDDMGFCSISCMNKWATANKHYVLMQMIVDDASF